LEDLERLQAVLLECGLDDSTGVPVIDLNRLTLPQLMGLIDVMGSIAENRAD
jgi:hypothetical protein